MASRVPGDQPRGRKIRDSPGGHQRFAGGRLRDIDVVDGELTLTNADGQERAIGRGLRADLLGWIAGEVRDVLRFDANGDDDASLA